MASPRLPRLLKRSSQHRQDAVERRFGRGGNRIRVWDIPFTPQPDEDGREDASSDDGTGEVPVFVLVHGWGVSSRLFLRVAARLRQHGRVLVFDLPGFNDVPHPDDAMGISAFAAAAARVLDELEVEQPVLVGHSMGAQVVVGMAHREPRLGGRMVLVSPVVPLDLRTPVTAARAFLRSSMHERFGAALWSVAGYFKSGLRWPLQILPSLLSYPIENEIEGLGGRLVIVRGEHDLLCPQDWADGLLKRSGAVGQVVVIDGAAHQVVVDDAARIEEVTLSVAGGSQHESAFDKGKHRPRGAGGS